MNFHSNFIDLLVRMHNVPGAGFYEVAGLTALVSAYFQYKAKKANNADLEKLLKGLTLLGLGVIFVECLMTILKHAGSMFFLG